MYGRNVNLRFGGPITPVVKKIMIINGAVFIVQQLAGIFAPNMLEYFFGLHYYGLINELKIWQPLTYMFLHGGWLHIIFNLLALWMFAGELEELWGGQKLLKYYIYSGIGAGIFISLMNFYIFVNYNSNPVTIGASGALYAILLAYGVTWPNREVLLYFIIPVKVKYLVIGFGLFEFFGTLTSATGGGGNISHIGHLGGLLSGLIFIFLWRNKKSTKIKITTPGKEGAIKKFFRKLRNKKKQKEIDTRIEAKRIIDELLEKIARNGMSSLSSDEKKKLEWARKHYYPERNETLH